VDRGREIRGFGEVVEGRVDDAVRCGGAAAKAVEVVEGAAVHLGAGRRQRSGSGVRAGEADDLMPCFKQLADDGGSDESCCTGDEYTHSEVLFDGDSIALSVLLGRRAFCWWRQTPSCGPSFDGRSESARPNRTIRTRYYRLLWDLCP
jgi:hypothetical protein